MQRPLIFDFCIPQKTDDENPFYSYDLEKNLNVVSFDGKTIPFIEYEDNVLEIITKTSTRRESDDDDRIIYEMDTITKVDREGVDEVNHIQRLSETETTTRVMREGSDIDLCGGILELMTKTDVVRERDDE